MSLADLAMLVLIVAWGLVFLGLLWLCARLAR